MPASLTVMDTRISGDLKNTHIVVLVPQDTIQDPVVNVSAVKTGCIDLGRAARAVNEDISIFAAVLHIDERSVIIAHQAGTIYQVQVDKVAPVIFFGAVMDAIIFQHRSLGIDYTVASGAVTEFNMGPCTCGVVAKSKDGITALPGK